MIPSFSRIFALVPNWLIPSGIVLLTAIAALALFRLVLALARRVLGTGQPLLHSILSRAAALLHFAWVFLAVAIVTPLLPLDASTTNTLNRIEIAALVVMLGWIALVASDLAVERYPSFPPDPEGPTLCRYR